MTVAPIKANSNRAALPKKSCIKKQQCIRKRQRNNNTNAIRPAVVKFGQLEIVELAYILGDHPACTTGVPLAMGNERIFSSSSQEEEEQQPLTMHIDYFEQYRPRRRTTKEMIMSKQRRYVILFNSGYTKDEIKTSISNVKKVKQQRMETVNQVYYEEFRKSTTSNSNKSSEVVVIDDDTTEVSSGNSSTIANELSCSGNRILLPVQIA